MPIHTALCIQHVRECMMECHPHTGSVAITEAPPAGHSTGEAIALGQGVPPDTFLEDRDDASQRGTRTGELSATFGL